jgi:hypothetical protein
VLASETCQEEERIIRLANSVLGGATVTLVYALSGKLGGAWLR